MKKPCLFLSFILVATIFLSCKKNAITPNYDWIPTNNKSILLDSNVSELNTRSNLCVIDRSNGFLSVFNYMVTPQKYRFLRLFNGGQNFEEISYPTGNQIRDLSFINNHNGYILTTDVSLSEILLYTEDGGESWTKKNTISENPIRYIHFSSIDSGIAISERGMEVFYTTDGGNNWLKNKNKVFSNYKTIRNFSFIHNEPNICFLTLGDSLAYSIDGGYNWQFHSYVGSGIYYTSFINLNTGYIASLNNIYKITNIGGALTKVYTSEDMIDRIEAINDSEVYFTRFYKIYRTVDNFRSVNIMSIEDPYPNEKGDRFIIDFTLFLGNGILIDSKGTIYRRN
jgi:hypothetical protein